MAIAPGILARGPWSEEQVEARWRDDAYEPAAEISREADAAIAALRERGSPSYDGASARLVDFGAADGRLSLELQPARWSLRLTADSSGAMSVLCVIRRRDGSWLAGRRAPWLASWAGRWALGAGGAVEVGENPAGTLRRELHEEWALEPEHLSIEALVRLPSGMAMLVGLGRVADDAEVVRDAEHDDHAWWPADVDAWPEEADVPLRRMARLLAAA